jgi:PrtD family type I secretion system ABC transporter
VLLFALALLNDRLTQKPQRVAAQQQAGAYRFSEVSMRNAEVVQAMGMMPNLTKTWDTLNASALDAQDKVSARSAAILGTSRFVRFSVQAGILGLGALLVLSNELTPGQMIAASILLGRALAPVEQSIMAWRGYISARTSYGKLKKLFSEVPEAPPAIVLPEPRGQIDVENISFVPEGSDKPVLHRVSFGLAPGEALGIVGPSAAGKSTLCRLLVGVWAPTLGSVRLDSGEVTQWNREAFGRHVGYLPQDVELFSGTVRQNIARMGEANDDDIVEAAQLANAHDMILRLPEGYETPIGEGGAKLSAGQRQRVGLARALFQNPQVIVLDEPNSNLDKTGEMALLTALKTLRDRGTTIIVVAHHATMLEHIDKMLVLRDGKMVAFGPKNTVLAQLSKTEGSAPPPSPPSTPATDAAPGSRETA